MTDLTNLRTVLQDPDILTQLCRMSLYRLGTNAQSSLSATCHRFGQSIIESYNVVDAAVVENMTKVYRHHFSAEYVTERQHQSFELRCMEYLKDCLLVVEHHLAQPRKTPFWQCRKTSPLEVIPSAPASPKSACLSEKGDASRSPKERASKSSGERKSSPAQMMAAPGFPLGRQGSQMSQRNFSRPTLWTPATSPSMVPRVSLSLPYLTDFKALAPSPPVATRALTAPATHPGSGQSVDLAAAQRASATNAPKKEVRSPSAEESSRPTNSPFMLSRITSSHIKPAGLQEVLAPGLHALPRSSAQGTAASTATLSSARAPAASSVPKNDVLHHNELHSVGKAQRVGDEPLASPGRHTAGAELFRNISRVSATTRMGQEQQLQRVEEAVEAATCEGPWAPSKLLALTRECGPKVEIHGSSSFNGAADTRTVGAYAGSPSSAFAPLGPTAVTPLSVGANSPIQEKTLERVSPVWGRETVCAWQHGSASGSRAHSPSALLGDNNMGSDTNTGRQQQSPSSHGQRPVCDRAPAMSITSVAPATVRTMQDIEPSKAPKSTAKAKVQAKVDTFRKPQSNPQRAETSGYIRDAAAREQTNNRADTSSRQRNANLPSPRSRNEKPTSASSSRRTMHTRDKRAFEMKANRFAQGVLGGRLP